MIKIFNIIIKKEDEEKRQEETLLKLETENICLKDKLKNYSWDLIDVDLSDPSPTNPEERKEYVVRCAIFFKDILEKKIKFSLSKLHNDLEKVSADRETDFMYKGACSALREIWKWGKRMVNENIENNINNNDSQESKQS